MQVKVLINGHVSAGGSTRLNLRIRKTRYFRSEQPRAAPLSFSGKIKIN
jgi:hypothetical protein